MASVDKITIDGTNYDIDAKTVSGHTVATDVPSDAVFTDHYTWSDITNKPSSYTPASHTHGNIQNGGILQTSDITITNGDKLVVTDSSDSNKVARTSVSFDGSTTTKCLTQKGTWESFSNNTGTVTSVKVGTTEYNPYNGVVSLPAYPSGGEVNDVQVNSTSVVSSGVANIPLVSSASAGVAPKGTTVSTQSQSTKFLREDGSWAAPSYTTNTTYTFAEGTTDGTFKVTPSGGSAQSVAVHNVVKKTGDTLSGSYTVEVNSSTPTHSFIIESDGFEAMNPLAIRNTVFDCTKSATYGNQQCGISFMDKNDSFLGDLLIYESTFNTSSNSGDIGIGLEVKGVNGTYNKLGVVVDTNGTQRYEVSNPAGFRSAINIKDTPYTIESGGTQKSLTSGSYTDLASFVLDPGTWVISYKGQFAGATGGLRRVLLGGSGASSAWNNTRTTAFASSDNVMEIGWTTIVTVSSSTTRYLVGYQNSGGAVNCTGYVQAVRINPFKING